MQPQKYIQAALKVDRGKNQNFIWSKKVLFFIDA